MSNSAFLAGLLAHERSLFTRVVGAVLDEGLEHRPDSRSRCSRELVEHLLGHNLDMIELIDDGVIHHRNLVPFESIAVAVQQLDESYGTILEKLGSMDEERWMAPSKFYVGDRVVMEGPRQQLAWILFLDSVHHRGQLSTHLRAMGSKVPAMYGPSADDQDMGH